jgi:hypothetical protein
MHILNILYSLKLVDTDRRTNHPTEIATYIAAIAAKNTPVQTGFKSEYLCECFIT